MARCTAPVEGHRSSAAAARCPACRGSYGRRRSYSYSPPSYYSPPAARPSYGGGGGGSSSGGGSTRLKRSTRSGRVSVVAYTDAEWRAVEPAFEKAEELAKVDPPKPRDVFLCHAWDDRAACAKDLYDLLIARGVSVWFSEKDVALGASLLRAIDRGLATSRIGIVLATPALLKSLEAQGIADKELSALLATERVVPVAHETTFDDVRNVSPLLAARAGLTSDGSLDDIAAKIADAVAV